MSNENQLETFWLSYAGPDGFRGVVIMDKVLGFLGACQISAALGLSPGGEVRGVPLPMAVIHAAAANGDGQARILRDLPRRRLLCKAELLATGLEPAGLI